MSAGAQPSNVERTFSETDIIVSKTDLKGKITYCNEIFCEIAGYPYKDLIGKPHSIIRHPDMPRSVFELLWKQIEAGNEIFAYVKNLCRGGEFYWVFAHVTPTYNDSGNIIGYHSTRRVPDGKVLRDTIIPFYEKLLEIERAPKSRKDGQLKGSEFLINFLSENRVTYDEFILTL
ncbi:PAS domain-containing protein [Pseudovibrio sp. Tun.PSC04-5.I4]|uniref:PAS domain-containing protein n=1 Tax=Pseudovibrio sp. Tun.PSC04-5.I4 TaxID=1798213 RepID=UPI000889B6FE|nr:PAS domain-containing protein [Pseudovibrio sp. Tun.PSC04-5.I4]SDQ20187.1 PAS domain S-box-containing protein [Pseudovibrio sp. Tun.PSC04-5.I4]